MKLFFETGVQAVCFLMAAPAGFVSALLLDADVIAGPARPAADILVMLACGAALMGVIVYNGESGLRLYHLLGLLSGAVLYLCGAGKVIRLVKSRMRKRAKRAAGQESAFPAEK